MSTGSDPKYNANCPFCGEESLLGTVQAVNEQVPFLPGNYDFDEGVPVDTEILEMHCSNCLKEVYHTHYFDHGEGGIPCDCAEIKEEPSDM